MTTTVKYHYNSKKDTYSGFIEEGFKNDILIKVAKIENYVVNAYKIFIRLPTEKQFEFRRAVDSLELAKDFIEMVINSEGLTQEDFLSPLVTKPNKELSKLGEDDFRVLDICVTKDGQSTMIVGQFYERSLGIGKFDGSNGYAAFYFAPYTYGYDDDCAEQIGDDLTLQESIDIIHLKLVEYVQSKR